jgi:Holliday junction DNA helicase RuvB
VSEARKRLLGPDDAAEAPDDESRAVDPKAALEDEVYGASLRPRSFDEYIGQANVVENLKIAIDAANKRNEVLDHVLLYGPPGLGKTTLAALIAHDLHRSLRPTSGPTLEKPKDLVGILTSLEEGDVLFIDEIHRLGSVVEEFLYPAMEEFQIDFLVDRGAYAKTLRLPLKRFTLIGATTRQGPLSAPLRERFGIVHHLDFYEQGELERIVAQSAERLGVPTDDDGATMIATRSRGTPRIANRLLRRVRDYAEVRAEGRINASVADEALTREGVDHLGLDKLDRAFLRTIAEHYGGGPVGINAIAATLTEDVETLEDVVEPYLLKIGFVQRTASGRRLTPAAFAHLRIAPPSSAQPRLL